MSRDVVLIVEDEALVAERLKDTLEELGCEVLGPAPNCSAALEVLWARKPDVAFVDTHLGEETCDVGVEECDLQGVPVVITTGLRLADLPVLCQDRNYMAKPYRDAEVEATLRLHRAGVGSAGLLQANDRAA